MRAEAAAAWALQHGLGGGVSAGPHEPVDFEGKEPGNEHYQLFRAEDATSWLVFTGVFFALVLLDNLVLHRAKEVVSMRKATLLTFFWLCCALGFAGYVWGTHGRDDALNWLSGYLLEWLLSMDNLFVFHLVFHIYACPDESKHKPLFWGIVGAVFFRMVFFIVGEVALHAFFFMHLVFGVFLVYTGIQSSAVDDDDGDPTQNPFVVWLAQNLPMINRYDDEARFFVKVAVSEGGLPVFSTQAAGVDPTSPVGRRLLDADWGSTEVSGLVTPPSHMVTDSADGAHLGEVRYEWRATMLFLVVCCLEAADILFAVDSVSAIVAQIDDLYLAYTAAVFAMLGLRSAFFIVDELVKWFHLLKYGVGFILVFIGVKLCVSKLVHVNPAITCAVLFTALLACIVASAVWPRQEEAADDESQVHKAEAELEHDAKRSARKLLPGTQAVAAIAEQAVKSAHQNQAGSV